jgi:hypothetical protein
MTRIIAFGFVLVALVLFAGCTAKDYNDRNGPYEVNFTLPDEVASSLEVNKTVTSGEALDGNQYDRYRFNLQVPGGYLGGVWISRYKQPLEINISAASENAKEIGKGNGYQICNSAQRTIDGRNGYIVNCFGGKANNSVYQFGYQLNNQTIVQGVLSMDWDTKTLPFLKSLHVREVA